MAIGASCGTVNPDTGSSRTHARHAASVLVVDPDPAGRNHLQQVLRPSCALVECADSLQKAQALRSRCHFDVFVITLSATGSSALEWLQTLREQNARADVILTAASADLSMAIAALRAGASDLLVKPYRDEQLLASIHRCLRRRQMLRESFLLRRREQPAPKPRGLIGDSAAMRQIFQLIERIAPTNSTVLLEGETGTGKEVIARAIHRQSGRKGDFVAVNCGSITPELLESELFGHTRGAFTGAHAARQGLFTCANEGTIFLDEIGEMPLAMQANLLRVLEERCVRPVGANREQPVNCRVIAATNLSLTERVAGGAFREDLYYRLNVLTITVPTLRDRPDDIPALVEHFSRALSEELGVAPLLLGEQEVSQMQHYAWPGNVRELRNTVERAMLLGQFPATELQSDGHGRGDATGAPQSTFPHHWTMSEVEKHHMLSVLDCVGGNKSEAARRLGVSRKTLERKLNAWKQEG